MLMLMFTLAQVLGGARRPNTNIIVYAFVAGALLTVIEFVCEVGLATTSDWMVRSPHAMPPHLSTPHPIGPQLTPSDPT